jgi:hypothetical protein
MNSREYPVLKTPVPGFVYSRKTFRLLLDFFASLQHHQVQQQQLTPLWDFVYGFERPLGSQLIDIHLSGCVVAVVSERKHE